MKIIVNPWKLLIGFAAIISSGIFMIPTENAIENFVFIQWGFKGDWLWIPVYFVLWRVWYGVEWLWKTYREMKHDE